jgi:starch synthase (maltosyl-transferring)
MALTVYNLFPTLVGPVTEWPRHAERARRMGFDWVYVNPFSYPGFSGSLYAIKEHWRLHPALEPAGPPGGLEALGRAVAEMRHIGVEVMMDLVVNHVSKDSPLVELHPSWFGRDADGQVRSPSVADPDDTTKITVWGDLAEVDNAESPDRDALWGFWAQGVDRAIDLGFTGFRCDAAYKVPAELWARLAERARARVPGAVFVAETLGCTLEEATALGGAGFDYFYNSSKWWDLEAPWFLEQHELFRGIAPSVSFPESHDTPRLASETGASEAVQRQRYALAAVVAAGVQITIGYEFGFRRPLDVVKTRPEDWEDGPFDLQPFVARVNRLKGRHPLLAGEGLLRPLDWGAAGVTVLRRWSDEGGAHRGVILANRSTDTPGEVAVDPAELPPAARLYRLCLDDVPDRGADVPDRVALAPAEAALIASAP